MKLFLFGGAKAQDGHADIDTLMKLIEATIRKTWVRQVFHIPYARTIATEPERDGDWFHRHIHIEELEYLNANTSNDIDKIDKPLVFVSGGGETQNLLNKLNEDPRLLEVIKSADYYIGESSGAMVMGEYVGTRLANREKKIIPWLWLIQDCIIEPHYIEKNRQSLLLQEMKDFGLKYGIGIDSDTGIEIDLATFPKYNVIGNGIIEVKISTKK